jgi:peroxiredoxin
MDPHDLLNEWLRTTFPAGPPSRDKRMMPSFLLPDSEGWLVSSEEMRAQGPYVITFFHGSWCGSCVEKLTLFEAGLDRIHQFGADLIACSPETLGHPRRLKAEKELRYRVLSDVDCALSADLGLAYTVPADLRALLRDAGVDLTARNGDRRWLLPVPMTMIVDREGQAVATCVDTGQRIDFEGVIRVLAELH